MLNRYFIRPTTVYRIQASWIGDRRIYINQVKRCFIERSCVGSVFTAANEKLAAQLHREGIPIVEVEPRDPAGLGFAKYIALLNNGGGTPIITLHYFTALFTDVRQEVSEQWHYLAHKVRTLEQRFRRSAGQIEIAAAKAETHNVDVIPPSDNPAATFIFD